MSFDRGFWWPFSQPGGFSSNSGIIDATGEIVACIGRIAIAGKATNKTLDTTGSSSIKFALSSNPVFDNASSVFTIGIQGVNKTTGFPVRPDGAWGARAVVTTAANTTPTLTTTSTFHTIVPTAGSTTLSHGDEIAFVCEMTTKAGTDSLAVSQAGFGGVSTNYPACVTNVSGSWAVLGVGNGGTCFEITFSDGTIGTIDFTTAGYVIAVAVNWNDTTNPDEHGLIFQVPFACKIDALCIPLRVADATADFQIDLTSTPNGTPASLISGPIAIAAENVSVANTDSCIIHTLASEVSLSANTDYCISVKATGTTNIRFSQLGMISAGGRIFVGSAGTTMGATTRNGGSGAYAAKTTTAINPFSVRISEITTGGGLLTHPGMTGGMRG